MPDKEMNKKSRGFSEQCTTTLKNVDVTAVGWKDNKVVLLASTFVVQDPKIKLNRYVKKQRKQIEVDTPQIVSDYNQHTGGVDLIDSLIARYRNKMRSRKWYKRIFHHLLDGTIVNSWLLYKRRSAEVGIEPMTLLEFRLQQAVSLCKY